MYSENPINAQNLADKTLCLTFDDGPGRNTLEIAKFLHEHQIPATFFVVGKYAAERRETVVQMSEMGHLIGNHTYDHPDLPFYVAKGGDVQAQILRTEVTFASSVNQDVTFFRSPYGKWSKEVARELNKNWLCSFNHIGPIYWDIGGVDCVFWENKQSVAEATDAYLLDIEKRRKGIVVFHDEIADNDSLIKENRTLELMQQLIPRLIANGYKFIRLDEIESIKSLQDQSARFAIVIENGLSKTSLKVSNESLSMLAQKIDKAGLVRFQSLGYGRLAIRTEDGTFFSLNTIDQTINAAGNDVGENESFQVIPLAENRVVIRANNGNYVSLGRDSRKLMATEKFMRKAAIFSLVSSASQLSPVVSLPKLVKGNIRMLKFFASKAVEMMNRPR